MFTNDRAVGQDDLSYLPKVITSIPPGSAGLLKSGVIGLGSEESE